MITKQHVTLMDKKRYRQHGMKWLRRYCLAKRKSLKLQIPSQFKIVQVGLNSNTLNGNRKPVGNGMDKWMKDWSRIGHLKFRKGDLSKLGYFIGSITITSSIKQIIVCIMIYIEYSGNRTSEVISL